MSEADLQDDLLAFARAMRKAVALRQGQLRSAVELFDTARLPLERIEGATIFCERIEAADRVYEQAKADAVSTLRRAEAAR